MTLGTYVASVLCLCIFIKAIHYRRRYSIERHIVRSLKKDLEVADKAKIAYLRALAIAVSRMKWLQSNVKGVNVDVDITNIRAIVRKH